MTDWQWQQLLYYTARYGRRIAAGILGVGVVLVALVVMAEGFTGLWSGGGISERIDYLMSSLYYDWTNPGNLSSAGARSNWKDVLICRYEEPSSRMLTPELLVRQPRFEAATLERARRMVADRTGSLRASIDKGQYILITLSQFNWEEAGPGDVKWQAFDAPRDAQCPRFTEQADRLAPPFAQ